MINIIQSTLEAQRIHQQGVNYEHHQQNINNHQSNNALHHITQPPTPDNQLNNIYPSGEGRTPTDVHQQMKQSNSKRKKTDQLYSDGTTELIIEEVSNNDMVLEDQEETSNPPETSASTIPLTSANRDTRKKR